MTTTTAMPSSSFLQNIKVPAQILAITTSALFAGYVASLSLITVPMMLEHFGSPPTSTTKAKTTVNSSDAGGDAGDDKDHVDATMKVRSNNREVLLLSQWRQMYVHGARTSRPATAIPVICYLFLLYTCLAEGKEVGRYMLLRYMVALMGQCGIVLALTVLRRTNGALGLRCAKVLAPPPPELQDISLRYANHEARSIEREVNIAWTSERLVRRWKWHNDVRSVLLIGGVVAGVYAVVLDSRG